MFKTPLFVAIASAEYVIAGGYEIDTIAWTDDEVHLSCSDDPEFTFYDQEIEINEEGESSATDCEGNVQPMAFQMIRPLVEADLCP